MTEEAKPYQDTIKALEDHRRDYEDEYNQISLYLMPRKGFYINRGDRPEDKREKSKIIDPKARDALRFLAGGILGGMTPKSRPWLRLSLRDDELMEYAPVKTWFHDATVEMLDVFGWSNLYVALNSIFKEVAGFGTGCMIEEEDFETMIYFTTFTAGEYYLGVNAKGIVDQFYRHFKWTAQNIVEMFPDGNLEDEIKKAAEEDSQKLKYFDICHCIQPNKYRNTGRLDGKNLPFESVYWQYGKTSKIIKRSGYQEFPIFAPRWDTVTTHSVYGEGPGQDQLGNTKMLQEMAIGQIKAIHKELDPPMRIPPNYEHRLSLLPGAQNVDPTLIAGNNGKGIDRLFEFNFDYKGVSAKIEDVREQIRQGFYNDLFRMTVDRPGAQPPTAREIAERHEEKMILLSPLLERLHNELLNPMIKRTFNIMLRNGALPPPPEEIEGAEIKVEYTSILSQAQKLMGLQSVDAFIGFLGQAATIMPQIIDKVDGDEMVDQYAEMTGVPPKIVLPDEDVKKMREARAQQEQAMEAMAAAEQAGKVAKDLGSTPIDENTALGQLMAAAQTMGGMPSAG